VFTWVFVIASALAIACLLPALLATHASNHVVPTTGNGTSQHAQSSLPRRFHLCTSKNRHASTTCLGVSPDGRLHTAPLQWNSPTLTWTSGPDHTLLYAGGSTTRGIDGDAADVRLASSTHSPLTSAAEWEWVQGQVRIRRRAPVVELSSVRARAQAASTQVLAQASKKHITTPHWRVVEWSWRESEEDAGWSVLPAHT
jgi:hypothetical protein